VSFGRLALLASVAVLAASCELPFENETVAHVGDRAISKEDVERTVEHYEEEFAREGREFPERGSPAYEQLERTALGLLVFREQLEQAADGFGVELPEEEVERRVERARAAEGETEGETEGEGADFFEGAVRTQMIREAVAQRLFPGLTLSEAEFRAAARRRDRRPTEAFRREVLQERRNAALAAWIADARRSISVDYEAGWEPKT
jgi:SurA-like protein